MDEKNMSDRELLIVLHTLLKRGLEDIQKIGENTVDRHELVEHVKADNDSHKDHETRLRRLEYAYFAMLGGFTIIEIVLKIFK